ncbi:septal ring lytic transglycosylase RlpA family protein [Eionea flava]
MKRILLLTSLTVFLSACSSMSDLIPTSISTSDRGDSAPSEQRDISQIADAQPQPVIRTRAGNKSPYTVLGKTYTLLPSSEGYQEQGGASWYGTKFHGRRTANGEVYDMWGMTAAHKTLPIPSYVRVTNLANGRSIIVLVNDRGPFHSERIIDLSYAAALKLGFAQQGVADVEVMDVTPLEQSAVVPRAISSPASPSVAQTQPVNEVPVVVPVAPPLAPVVNTSSSSTSSVSFQPVYFQAGAFRSLDSANKLQKKLQSSAIRAPVVVVPNQEGSWHRVRVGPLTSAQRVSETKQLLYEQGVKKPQLVKSP